MTHRDLRFKKLLLLGIISLVVIWTVQSNLPRVMQNLTSCKYTCRFLFSHHHESWEMGTWVQGHMRITKMCGLDYACDQAI